MDVSRLIARLAATPDILDALLAGLPADAWTWRPADGGWSLVEIVNHLADEDPLDFRVRTQSVLEDPERDFPPTDPQGDILRKGFQGRDPAESLRRFREERNVSLTWLRSLPGTGPGAPDWDRARVHPVAGPLRAGDLLVSWAVHDARHLTQISKRLVGLSGRDGQPYSADYAG